MAAAAPDRYGANAPPLIPLDDGPSPPAAAAAAGGAPAVGGSSRPKGILKNASSSAVKTVSGGSTHGAAAGLASGSSSGQHAPASGSGAATGDVAMDDGVAGEPERGCATPSPPLPPVLILPPDHTSRTGRVTRVDLPRAMED